MTDNSALQSSMAFLGRLLLSGIFLTSGFGKLADPSGTIGYIASAGLPLPSAAYVVALVVEIGVGILLVIGYRARWMALVLAAFTLASAVGFHANFADQNQMIHFMKNLAIAGGFLQIAAFGAGAFSLDRRAGRI
ncbi:DoxX family protein [Sinorhizobium arboris]|uniref:DoxX family protein n=1 Tax=Sinorhizobium arboris TaxID=76745 RepID=UPI00041BE7C7|nr:DoxX family protein [Sinorhizobium arboris]